MKLLTKITALMMVTVMFFGLFTGVAYAENYNSFLKITFGGCSVSNTFGDNLAGCGFSYAGGVNAKVSSNAISGKTAQLNSADLRMWSMNVTTTDKFYFELSVKVDGHFSGEFYYALHTQDPNTNTEGLNGWLLKITKNASGDVVLKNKASRDVMTLQNNTIYRIRIEVTRGNKTYDIYVNDALIAADNRFSGPFYAIYGLRVNFAAANSTDYIFVDDINVYTTLSTPQTYSSQAPGAMPTITLPAESSGNGIHAFYNGNEIALSGNPMVVSNVVSLPLGSVLSAAGGSYYADGDKLYITYKSNSVVAQRGSPNIKLNGTTKRLSANIDLQNNKDYAPLDFFNLVLGVKVWYDATGKIVALTDKDHCNEDILRAMNGKLFMNGEPYYEISFNKFDLAYQMQCDYFGYTRAYPSAVYTYAAAEDALRILRDNGFNSIRVFCSIGNADVLQSESTKRQYYECFDSMFDLCDRYGIQVVVCMGLPSDTFLEQVNIGTSNSPVWFSTGDTALDLVANPNCASRQTLYAYIREFVSRYKDRRSVLMWEIVNEGNLGADVGPAVGAPRYSLLQLGEFYSSCAAVIRETDPVKLVTGGDSILRSAQWHLLKSTMSGSNTCDWTIDTYKERLYALWVMNENLDVISAHCYNTGLGGDGSYYTNAGGTRKEATFSYMMSEAKRLGKIFYNGETAYSFDTYDSNAASKCRSYLNSIIDAGVQLSHWWTFHTDRQGYGDGYGWKITDGQLLTDIANANRQIKERYVVNNAASANKVEPYTVSDEVQTPTPTATPTPTPTATPTPTPTPKPTATPTPKPTATPTPKPTATPTPEPTATPTPEPTATPTPEPTATPTPEPTATPTPEPTATPTAEPTATPTAEPTATPTAEPTATPTAEPTATPTNEPTSEPTDEPDLPPVTPTAEPGGKNGCHCILTSVWVFLAAFGLVPLMIKRKKRG